MTSSISYTDADGNPLTHIADRIHRAGSTFRSSKLELVEGFYYDCGAYPAIWCPEGFYDGFSVPAIVRLISFGAVKGLMPVVQCTYVHDELCKAQLFTKADRAKLFAMSYDDAVTQFYGGVYPSRRRDRLVKGVVVGSKYLGAC